MSKTYIDKLRDPRWQIKRLKIFERDKFTCQKCSTTTKTLVVHHKEYRNACEPWDYPDDCLITYCEDCHKIDHDLIPELKFSTDIILCPFCHSDLCHITRQEHIAGGDDYQAWEGRGDLYLTFFDGECGSVFAQAYGEHKGNIIQGIIYITNCKRSGNG
jgi:uncharacterized protein YbaR (Trm112 family)